MQLNNRIAQIKIDRNTEFNFNPISSKMYEFKMMYKIYINIGLLLGSEVLCVTL